MHKPDTFLTQAVSLLLKLLFVLAQPLYLNLHLKSHIVLL